MGPVSLAWKYKSTRTARGHSGAGYDIIKLKLTIFATLGGVRRCGGHAFFDKYLFLHNRMAAFSYVPPVDIKTAALNNQNRRWKERLDMGNRSAQQRFFSFLPLGRHFSDY